MFKLVLYEKNATEKAGGGGGGGGGDKRNNGKLFRKLFSKAFFRYKANNFTNSWKELH